MNFSASWNIQLTSGGLYDFSTFTYDESNMNMAFRCINIAQSNDERTQNGKTKCNRVTDFQIS